MSWWVFKLFPGKASRGITPLCLISQHPRAESRKPQPWAQTASKIPGRRISHWIFPPLHVDSGTHDAPKPLLLLKYHQEQGTAGKSLEVSSLCSTWEMPKPEVEHHTQVLAWKKKTVLFFQVFFHSFGSTTLITRLCGHSREGKASHTRLERGRLEFSSAVCPQTPHFGAPRALLASSQGSG